MSRYHLIERIGAGGMGEIFRARDRWTGQTVALKRPLVRWQPAAALARPGALTLPIRQRVATAPRTRPRSWAPEPIAIAGRAKWPERRCLRQEYRLLASLRHPGIVRVFDECCDCSGVSFFTMELLDGAGHLDTVARERPLRERVGLLLQVLQALTYLHGRKILHRDLKPTNILVRLDFGEPRVTLLDFGLATASWEEGGRTQPAGSIGYMAPEVQRGAAASAASELFSVGVMMHELLLDTHPLASSSMFDRLRGFHGCATSFSGSERLGPELSAVLRRALSFDPTQRYAHAEVFGQELARAAGLPWPSDSDKAATALTRT